MHQRARTDLCGGHEVTHVPTATALDLEKLSGRGTGGRPIPRYNVPVRFAFPVTAYHLLTYP
jgi:hypothetical protein